LLPSRASCGIILPGAVMEIFLLWIGIAVIVGVAANTRGRSGFGWFLLAVILSPLIAGLLVLALPTLRDLNAPPIPAGEPLVTPEPQPVPSNSSAASTTAFEPDGVYAGIPYKVIELGAVLALLSGGLVRFRDMDQFVAAANGETTAPTLR